MKKFNLYLAAMLTISAMVAGFNEAWEIACVAGIAALLFFILGKLNGIEQKIDGKDTNNPI